MNNNHHMGSGHPIPYHEQSRRQQQYHNHMYAPPPQSPINPYAYHHGPPMPFYPQQHPQQYPRWQQYPHQQYNPYAHVPPMPQQHVPAYPPRSPLVVSSQPVGTTPRQTPLHPQQHVQVAANSPRPVPQHMSTYTHNTNGLPSPAPTPPKREETPFEQVQQLPPREDTRSVSMSDTPSAPSRRQSTVTNVLLLPPETRTPYYPSLPWYSPDASPSAFPRRANARRKRQNLTKSNDTVALPFLSNASNEVQQSEASPEKAASVKAEEPASETSTVAATSARETPATSQAPSESDFTQVSTPTTPAQAVTSSPKPSGAPAQQHTRKDTRTAIAVPNIGGLPKAKGTPTSAEKQTQQPPVAAAEAAPAQAETTAVNGTTETAAADVPTSPPKPAAPKSWADLVRTKEAKTASAAQANGTSAPNGTQSVPKSAPLAEALRQHTVTNDSLSFLEPRGLVNPGNMCYMNSILQVLVFCTPFYDFLDQVRQRTVQSMKSDTPLVDVMIMFMREFKVLANAETAEKLRKVLRQEQFEQYGDPITPDYVYEAIRSLPRFQGMRRGHQQDAEEFLGFLLEGLHDECVGVIQNQANDKAQADAQNGESEDANGWLEVGPKQKSAVTRTAGQEDIPSPITKIFGGHLRSELRVPGQKDSVTLEPYKPLQLDIGSPQVNNIVDALKGLTHTEALTGDFGGRGNVTAKKQVFIDTLPPVLILHLKRFQYENALGGTQKIWKKVGYPLELEIPKDVLPPSKRSGLAVKGGLPNYRLISVVYHHGKSAAGGHYTVDVLRQDSNEWVRMDDTIIRRVRPQDVAEGGAEEDPKVLARALEQHKNDSDLQKQRNMYEGLDDEPEQEEKPWSEVNGSATSSAKKLAAAAQQSNGTATPASTAGKRTPTARREGVKDNKVAYILLYERIRS